jgi:hypothetical protein
MERNNLSSQPVPKLVLVFEGALAWVPPDDRKKQRAYERALSREKWGEMADLFEFNPRMEAVLWDRAYRMSMQIDICTYLGPQEWADEVARRIGEQELPVHSVWATTPQKLGRQLSYQRDIARVYDPWPQNALMYGPKGRHITDPNQFGY